MSASETPKPQPKSQVRRPFLTKKRTDVLFALLLIAPAFVVLALVVFVPILQSIRYSFTDYTLATRLNPTWNNFENYRKLFASGEIFVYFKNTFVYVFVVVAGQFVVAMGIALLLNARIKGRDMFRGLFLLAWTIPSVVVAFLWIWMLHPQFGVLNFIFFKVGLVPRNMQWTQNPDLAMLSVVFAAGWRQAPMMIVMFLAGLQSVPATLMEAARIDGASNAQAFWHVVLPILRPVIGATLLIAIINNFQMFTIIFNMTHGGPLDRTTTLSVATYTEAFQRFNMGSGAAIGVLWLVVLVALTLFYRRYLEGDVVL